MKSRLIATLALALFAASLVVPTVASAAAAQTLSMRATPSALGVNGGRVTLVVYVHSDLAGIGECDFGSVPKIPGAKALVACSNGTTKHSLRVGKNPGAARTLSFVVGYNDGGKSLAATVLVHQAGQPAALPNISLTNLLVEQCTTPTTDGTAGWINCPATVTIWLNEGLVSGVVSAYFDYPMPGSTYAGQATVTGLGPVVISVVNPSVLSCIPTAVPTSISVYSGATTDRATQVLLGVFLVNINNSTCTSTTGVGSISLTS